MSCRQYAQSRTAHTARHGHRDEQCGNGSGHEQPCAAPAIGGISVCSLRYAASGYPIPCPLRPETGQRVAMSSLEIVIKAGAETAAEPGNGGRPTAALHSPVH